MKKIFTAIAMLLFAQNGIGQTFYEEDFENTTGNALPAGWQMTNDAGGVWKTGEAADIQTPGLVYGWEHTRAAGLELDTNWYSTQRTDIITSPSIALPSTVFQFLTLQVDLFSLTSNVSTFEYSVNNGATWSNAQYLNISAWDTKFLWIPYAVNATSIKFRFKVVTGSGSSFLGFFMDNLRFYSPYTVDAELYDLQPHEDQVHNYASPGQGVAVKGTVLNRAWTTLNDVVFKYQVDNGPVQTSVHNGINLGSWASTTITHYIPCTVAGTGNYTLKAWIEANGDGDNSDDTLTRGLIGASYLPMKIPVIEERGGTWCGWCVRGSYYNDSLAEIYGDSASIISVHNGDPMTITDYDSYIGTLPSNGVDVNFFGFPAVVGDRRETADPVNIFYLFREQRTRFGYGDIEIFSASLSGNELTLPVSFKPAIDMSGDYKLVLVITEDSVHKDTLGYAQTNSYSYQLQNIPFFGYESLPMFIPAADMYYNQVARVVLDGPGGTPSSLPASMTHDVLYTHTYNVTLNPAWNIEHLKAIAFIVDAADNDAILNSTNRKIPVALGVEKPEPATVDMKVYPNPANDVLYVTVSPHKAGEVVIRLVDMTGRIAYEAYYKAIAAGKQGFTVPVKEMPSGIYNLQVQTEEGTMNEKVNIVN